MTIFWPNVLDKTFISQIAFLLTSKTSFTTLANRWGACMV